MKSTIISVIIGVVLIIVAYFLATQDAKEQDKIIQNVSVVDGKQIIEIKAKGGYQPRKSIATSGTPTILRFNTSGTFDCSSSVLIPSMKISQNLAQTGTTDIDLGAQKAGVLKGSCGMGMYPFEIEFK
jgi:plastocyanin domain-containing protein